MANRKVLINLHSTKNAAPNIEAQSVFHGELVVSHPEGDSGLSATTIWTRNNNTMVPFASCAMTMQMIDNAITAADVTYDVKAAQGDAHVEVASGSTEKAKVFTVSSKDVQSKAAFDTYSAATKTRIDNITSAVTELTNVVVTDISGDTIIVAEKVDATTGSNSYNLTHKQAPSAIAADFNKLATDAYGHVTAATPVTTADIQALGFKTSAETGEDLKALSASVVTNKTNIDALSAGTQHDIETLSGDVIEYVKVVSGNIETVINELSANTMAGDAAVFASAKTYTDEAIKGLDSEGKVSAAGKYLTGIGIADGKISGITEADLPTLTKVVSGAGNVFTDIEVNDHEIVINKGMTVASDADLQALSGAVEDFSAATDTKFTALSAYTEDVDNKVKALSAGTIQLSADTVAYVNAVSGNIESVILAMDKDASAVAGQVVTTISQTDGKVAETKENVKDLQLGGYVKNAAATGDIAGTDTINTALSKLENKVGANKITNADKSIVVTEPTGTATTTDVRVNIKSGEKVIRLDGEGGGLYTNLSLVKLTESLPATVKERYEFRDSDGNKIGESIDIAKDSHIVSITYDETTQKLIYEYLDASGATKTTEVDMAHLILETEVENGIQSVNGKLSIKLDTTGDDTGDGKFLSVGANGLKLDGVSDAIAAAVDALDVTDTAVTGKYVSEVNETDGKVSMTRANVSEAPLNEYAKGNDATSVTSADTINGAVSKLENKIDVLAKATELELSTETVARQAIDGQNGSAYTPNASANYIAAATSLNDADVKLDAALKDVSDKINAAKVTEGSSVENYVALALDTATTAGTTALTINDSALKTKIDAIDAAITAETKARQDAIADLDSTAQTSGNGYFLTSVQLADGKITAATQSDKVNSASTADEAVKVKNALSISGYASSESTALDNAVNYDGSAAQSITFGKDTAAGKSMSFNGGVVDVEIIDCGEY